MALHLQELWLWPQLPWQDFHLEKSTPKRKLGGIHLFQTNSHPEVDVGWLIYTKSSQDIQTRYVFFCMILFCFFTVPILEISNIESFCETSNFCACVTFHTGCKHSLILHLLLLYTTRPYPTTVIYTPMQQMCPKLLASAMLYGIVLKKWITSPLNVSGTTQLYKKNAQKTSESSCSSILLYLIVAFSHE